MVGTVRKIENHYLIAQVYSPNAQAIIHSPLPQSPESSRMHQTSSIHRSITELRIHFSPVSHGPDFTCSCTLVFEFYPSGRLGLTLSFQSFLASRETQIKFGH